MSKMLYMSAMAQAVQEEMEADKNIVYMGEDIGKFGGTFFKNGLFPIYGKERVIEMPIAENLIVAAALGMATAGMRPICELMYADFISLAFDPICNEAPKIRFQSAGKASAPMTLISFQGTIDGSGSVHSQCVEAWIANVPGLKLVVPSIASDAKGLLKTAIRDNDPVVYLTHKSVMYINGDVPDGEYTIPFGKARVAREGRDVTIVAWQRCYMVAMEAAQELEEEFGISVEVIDPRTLIPLDKATILESVKKTGRFLVVHDAPKKYGVGGEIASMVAEEAYHDLKSAPLRLGAPSIPIPFFKLEEQVIVSKQQIKEAVKKLVNE
ncbi:alpha-ketoacid dehydrogenase subunit beta [Alkalibaculum sp. M08DMB]|uniref:Alpha-ketoacid dehydrogenase subunit beta n=1 Tax=Alkalibaculum sporogenes TaxID=2655001 RepID=A0A6A7KAK4_9FIRM|nr:transketolase C-terminal domain-containing protein [Alkalibaculum sporogenes]MPW26548.1 alpha-ketoacid dehydrogenase subunit beta [Alkalibaculum sporogenes]